MVWMPRLSMWSLKCSLGAWIWSVGKPNPMRSTSRCVRSAKRLTMGMDPPSYRGRGCVPKVSA